jgi:hypothetical protein
MRRLWDEVPSVRWVAPEECLEDKEGEEWKVGRRGKGRIRGVCGWDREKRIGTVPHKIADRTMSNNCSHRRVPP